MLNLRDERVRREGGKKEEKGGEGDDEGGGIEIGGKNSREA
jgi:hypothetical protein